MIVEIEPGGLRAHAGSLREIANDLDGTRSDILGALSQIGAHSSSVGDLGGVVAALRSRATDLEYRAGFVERLQPIALVATAPEWRAGSYDSHADASLADMDLLIADLDHRIEHWAGTDNDPILDEMIAARAALTSERTARLAVSPAELAREIAELEAIADYVHVTSLLADKREALAELTAAKTAALREALAVLTRLEGVPYAGTEAIADLYAATAAEVADLQRQLGVTAEDLAAAVSAMQHGLTPEEAALSPLLFDPSYLAATERVADAQREVTRLEAELAYLHHLAENEIPAAPGENRLLEAMLLEEAIEEARAAVTAVRADIAPPIGLLGAWIDGFDLIRPSEGDALFAEVLMAHVHADGNLNPTELAAGLAGADPAAAGAFFNLYGAYGTALLPWQVMNRFEGDGYGAGVPTLEAISTALADAQGAGHLTFSGHDLMTQLPAGGMAYHLLRFGDYSPRFLAEAGAALVGMGDDFDMSIQQTFFWPSLARPGSGDIWDPRAVVLGRAAESSPASVRLVELVSDNGDLRKLLAPDAGYFFTDEGAAAGRVLIHVGVAAAEETSGGPHTDLLARIIATAAEVGPTHRGVTDGLTIMLLPHLETFIPYRADHSYNGYHRDLPDTALNVALASLGANSTEVFRSVFDTIAASGSSDELGDAVNAWVVTKLYELHTAGGVESIAPYSDDLAGLLGLYADSAFDLDLDDARDRDRLNGWIRSGIRVITTAAVVAGTGGPMKIAELGLKKWIARQIVQGGTGAASAALFPIDNAEGVLEDRINAIHAELSAANLMFIALEGPDSFDPPYPFITSDGAPYLPETTAEFDEWKSQVIAAGYDYSTNVEHLEDVWLSIATFVDAAD